LPPGAWFWGSAPHCSGSLGIDFRRGCTVATMLGVDVDKLTVTFQGIVDDCDSHTG
jgi:hypothetical protein